MTNTSFSERLQQAMNIRNLKSSQIEKISEQLFKDGTIKRIIKMPLITDYLKGRYEAKKDNIYALSLILDVDENWLIGADVPMKKDLPFSAIYDFSTENEKNILNDAINYALQNNMIDIYDISKNSHIKQLLSNLDDLDIEKAIEFIQYFANEYRNMESFELAECIESLKYHKVQEPKIGDIYMHLAKEAQDLKLDEKDVDFILNFYKEHKK